MNTPEVISDLIAAQNTADSRAYADCFSESAIVFDECKAHSRKAAIKKWIEKANQTYKAVMKPLEYSESEETLSAEIRGRFPGSSVVLSYHFACDDGLISSLKIG